MRRRQWLWGCLWGLWLYVSAAADAWVVEVGLGFLFVVVTVLGVRRVEWPPRRVDGLDLRLGFLVIGLVSLWWVGAGSHV
jgi:hypothetical protein